MGAASASESDTLPTLPSGGASPLRACREPGERVDGEAVPEAVAYRISGTNMMCAFGVPGNMIHGAPGVGAAESPVLSAVAKGM